MVDPQELEIVGEIFDTPLRCQGQPGTDKEDEFGTVYGWLKVGSRNQYWALVQWDGYEEPDLYKLNFLYIEMKSWRKGERILPVDDPGLQESLFITE